MKIDLQKIILRDINYTWMSLVNETIVENIMTQSIQEEISREIELQMEGILNRIEDQALEIQFLQSQVRKLMDENARLKWALSEQD